MEEYEIEGDSSTTEETTDDSQETVVDVEKVLSTNKKLYARVKEAEAEAKRVKELEAEIEKLKNPVAVAQQAPTTQDSVSREEVILFAKGFTPDEVETLKKISAVEGAGLLATAESPIFKAWKDVEDKKKETQNSEIEVSRGSGKVPKKIDFKTPGLTDEQHRALFAKYQGR